MAPRPSNPDRLRDRAPDTIAAVATPAGAGGIGIVRISGPASISIQIAVCGRKTPARIATRATFRDGNGTPLDEGIVLYFSAPASFTGEDVVELQGHGGPVVMDLILRAAVKAGARLARPGEFTERAFLNGKIDLAQAEAVADLIASRSEAAALSAVRSLSGEFSERVRRLATDILDLRVYVEGAIDFPEEEVDFLSEGRVQERVERLVGNLRDLLAAAAQGVVLTEGVTLVLAGRPNVGKSSLMNRLLGYERAIVTATPGTTRDVLAETLSLGGVPVRLIDTAGLRQTEDEVEREGVRRARQEITAAQLILLVTDDPALRDVPALVAEQGLPTDRLTIIGNKIDLSGQAAGADEREGFSVVWVSARTGDGLDVLKRHLLARVGVRQDAEGVFSARRRHVNALEHALGFLERGREVLTASGAGELLADDLRRAHDCMGEIVGAVSSDALLGEIFSRFCIGK